VTLGYLNFGLWESHQQTRTIDIDLGQTIAQHSHDEVFKCKLYEFVWLEMRGSDPCLSPDDDLNLYLDSRP
jgi:hypothetical protein